MTDSKLISLLKALTYDEIKQLETFINSRFHNKGRDLFPFFKILKSFYPAFDHKNLNNEFIFKKIFPGKKYDSVRSENLIRTFSSHLFRICKEFLVNIELENQTVRKKYFLLNQLRKRKLYKEFDKEFESIDFEDAGKGSVGYFIDRSLISSVKRDCSLNRDDFENSFEYTLRTSENIALAALISVFKFEDEKNLGAAFNSQIRLNLLDAIVDNLNSLNLLEVSEKASPEFYPYIEIFHSVYLMNRYNENTDHYYKLKELLKKSSSFFGQAENYVLWNTMLTYAGVNKLGTKESFEIHKHIIKHGIYKASDSENFHIVLFRNIILTAAAIGEYKWLEIFIAEYSDDLHEKHRHNMRAYSMAYLYFARSEFEKALECILNIKYELFLYKLDVKILQSKIYYELRYYEGGLSLITATLSYLSSSKEVAGIGKESIGIFVKSLRDLIKIRLGGNHEEVKLHRLKLAAEKIIFTSLSDWLLEKIRELGD